MEVLCGIAELEGLPSEHTRMALEALMQAPLGHSGVLAAACWRAGHRDAGVREQALELLRHAAQASDVEAARTMLEKWWGCDAHALRCPPIN